MVRQSPTGRIAVRTKVGIGMSIVVAGLIAVTGCSAPGGADGGAAPSGGPVTGLSAEADGMYGTLVDDPALPRPSQVIEDTEGAASPWPVGLVLFALLPSPIPGYLSYVAGIAGVR